MFPKRNRITKREFDELMKNGRVFHSQNLSFRCFKKSFSTEGYSVARPKFAFVVSKKIAKSAVLRNTMRRRGFHALREIIFPNEITKINGFIGAFFYKKEGKKVEFEEIKKEIKGLLEKSGFLLS